MELIQEALQYPEKTPERRKVYNRILRLIQQSGFLRRDFSPSYPDALQQMWLYFFENLEQVDKVHWPRVKEPFKDHPCIFGRLNKFLKGRMQDEQ